jgi:hypothetical protein
MEVSFALTGVGAGGYVPPKWVAPTQSAQQEPASRSKVEKEFLDFARMTPAEKIRYSYLKAHGLTEEGLQGMDPDERARIEEKIRKEIEEALKKGGEKRPGLLADIRV